MSAVIGQILIEAREARGLTLEQVAEATHIRLRYLQAMEAGDFEALPSRLQMKGFLRAYASHLELDEKMLLDLLARGPDAEIEIITVEPTAPAEDPTPAENETTSRFVEVGQKLTAQRELLGLSLEDVERHTYLRIRYLRALEAGDLDGLPSPVQGRGMLKNYADFLGLDPDEVLMTFADGLQAGLTQRYPEISRPPAKAPQTPRQEPKRRLLNRDAVIGVFVMLFLLGFGVWGGLQIAEMRSTPQTAVPSPPSIAEVLLPTPTATLQPTPTATVLAAIDAEAIITPDQPNPAAPGSAEITPIALIGPVRLQVQVRERAYMRIVIDDEVEFDGRVLAGSIYAFAGQELIEIVTGSGSALQIQHNEQDIGALGTYGEAVNFVITIDGVQTPTPTITPTPTNTPTLETTPTPSNP